MDETGQISKFVKWMEHEGYTIFTVEASVERERILKELKIAPMHGSDQKHGFEYYQGKLAGFDSIISIFDVYKRRFDDLVHESAEKENTGG